MSFDKLSVEVLAIIFIFTDESSVATFAALSKTTRQIALAPWPASQYLLTHYGKAFALHRALSYPRLLSPALIDLLLTANANLSFYLATTLSSARTEGALHQWETSFKWGSVSSEDDPVKVAYNKILNLAQEKWPIFLGSAGHRQRAQRNSMQAFDRWETWMLRYKGVRIRAGAHGAMNLTSMPGDPFDEEAMKQAWTELVPHIQDRRFAPFSAKDPLNNRFARAVCLEPRLIPLLRELGWELDDRLKDNLVRWILFGSIPSPQSYSVTIRPNAGLPAAILRSDLIAQDLEIILRASDGLLRVSATVAGEVFSMEDQTLPNFALDPQNVLLHLQRVNLLDFKLGDVAQDLLNMADNTSIFPRRVNWIAGLIPASAREDVRARNVFTAAGLVSDVQQGVFRSDEILSSSLRNLMKLSPEGGWDLTPLINKLLLHPFVNASELRKVLYVCTDLLAPPMENILEDLAVKLVRSPMKGALLLELLSMHSYLKPILRTEILRHRVVLSRLPPTSTPDQFRPTFSSLRPTFLSPLSFDYQNARSRFFNHDMGPHPWNEDVYEFPPREPEDPDLAESIWPAKMKEFEFTTEDGKVVKLGKVTGRVPTRVITHSGDEDGAIVAMDSDKWIYDRVPSSSLPLAIALLDVFDKNDEALDVMLFHALLNLNSSVASFYLKNGVPVRPHHLEAVERLGLPQLHCVTQLLAENGGKLPVKEEKVKKQRWRKKKKSLGGKQDVNLVQISV